MGPRTLPLLLLFPLLLLPPPASQSPLRAPQLMLEILGPDLAVLLSGRPEESPWPPLDPSGGQPSPGTPALPPQWLPLLRELAQSQPRRFRGRGQKAAAAAGQGCFGVKLDRIGTFSGLGC